MSADRWAVAPGRSLTLDGAHRFSIAANDYGTGLGAAELDAMAHYVAALLNARPADDWPRFFAAYMAAPLGTVPALEAARVFMCGVHGRPWRDCSRLNATGCRP